MFSCDSRPRAYMSDIEEPLVIEGYSEGILVVSER